MGGGSLYFWRNILSLAGKLISYVIFEPSQILLLVYTFFSWLDDEQEEDKTRGYTIMMYYAYIKSSHLFVCSYVAVP